MTATTRATLLTFPCPAGRALNVVVDAAPPLTGEQCKALVAILGPASSARLAGAAVPARAVPAGSRAAGSDSAGASGSASAASARRGRVA